MVIVFLTNKGYTLIEMLLVIIVISLFALTGIYINKDYSYDYYDYLNEYLLKQSEAMLDREDKSMEYGISFNSMGHINQARTIKFDNRDLVIHLGNGYAFIR